MVIVAVVIVIVQPGVARWLGCVARRLVSLRGRRLAVCAPGHHHDGDGDDGDHDGDGDNDDDDDDGDDDDDDDAFACAW